MVLTMTPASEDCSEAHTKNAGQGGASNGGLGSNSISRHDRPPHSPRTYKHTHRIGKQRRARGEEGGEEEGEPHGTEVRKCCVAAKQGSKFVF